MSKMLDFLYSIASEDDAKDIKINPKDDVITSLWKMSNPDNFDSELDLNDSFDELFGYSPNNYFKKNELLYQLDIMKADAPNDGVRNFINKHSDEIVDIALQCIDDLDEEICKRSLKASIESTTGWKPSVENQNINDILNMSIYDEDSDDYEDDTLSSSSYDEDDSDDYDDDYDDGYLIYDDDEEEDNEY